MPTDMILTETNATQMARDDPDGAREFDGAYFHANECTYASPGHDSGCEAYCNGLDNSRTDREPCGWQRTYDELGTDDVGYYVVPPLCPECWLTGDVSGVRTRLQVNEADDG